MQKKKIKPYLALVCFIILVICITFYVTKVFAPSFSSKNIVDNKLIYWGTGWKNKSTSYSGNEIRFTIINSKKVSVKVTTSNPEPQQEVEIIAEGKSYSLSSPDLNKKELTIHLDKKSYTKSTEIHIRTFCIYSNYPCNITIDSINVDNSTKLLDTPDFPSKTLAILGDSISSNFGKENYTRYLADKLGYQLHNASIFGSTLTKNTNKRDVITRYKKDILNFKPDIIIIFIGANDAIENKSLTEFVDNYKTIIKDIKASNRLSKIIVVGILKNKISNSNTSAYNSSIQNIAKNENIPYIDTYDWLNDNDYMDDIHPSLQAQEKLSAKFSEAISTRIK